MQDKHQKARSSLAAKLLRTVLSIYFIAAMSATCVQLFLEYRNEKKRLAVEIGHVAETFTPILAQAIWNLDDEQIRSSLESILINNDVLGVQIRDDKGGVISSLGVVRHDDGRIVHVSDEEEEVMDENVDDQLLGLYHFDNFIIFDSPFRGRQYVGKIILYTSSDVVFERATYTFYITIINAIIKTLFLWVIFYIILNRLVARPLDQLTIAINYLNPESEEEYDMDDIVDPNLLEKDDELGVMVRAFKAMKYALLRKQRALDDYRRHLEEKVEERTLKLENASKAKSEFLANMSHEIRTPMNGMLGMTTLLYDTPLNEKQLQHLKVIQSSGRALLAIINDVLDYSKIEAGKMEIEKIRFDIEELVDDCVAIFSVKAAENDVIMMGAIRSTMLRWVKGDPTRIRQVLMNLLGNAFKFTKHGEVVLDVERVGNTDNGETLVRFSVHDTGVGISEEKISKLFQSFSQADTSTTRKYGGTGLGLAISKQLAELMGGVIGVESEEGKGSVFWIELPLEEIDVPLDTDTALFHKTLQGCRLLVVNQTRVFRDVIVEATLAWGVETQVAEGGILAKKMIKQQIENNQPYDLVLIDLSLPDISGLTLSEELQTTYGDDAPTIILNGAIRHSSFDTEVSNSSFEFFIENPVSNKELKQILVKAMGIRVDAEEESFDEEDCDYSHIKVLVVEDNIVNQMVVKGLLKKLGIDPGLASNGLEAIEACKASPDFYDLVLMDCEMPELDGWEATRQIRSLRYKRSNGENVRIVALSAHAMSIEREKAQLAGMDDYLSKPVTLVDLENTFQRLRL